jgi:hypothetical protein
LLGSDWAKVKDSQATEKMTQILGILARTKDFAIFELKGI